jgi:hypothetical protein
MILGNHESQRGSSFPEPPFPGTWVLGTDLLYLPMRVENMVAGRIEKSHQGVEAFLPVGSGRSPY